MFRRLFFELPFLWCLWVLYLVGAALATVSLVIYVSYRDSNSSPLLQSLWGDLSFCWQFHACRLLTALVAFSWIGWITISVLWVTTLIYAFTNNAWKLPSHGRWIRTRHDNKEGYPTA